MPICSGLLTGFCVLAVSGDSDAPLCSAPLLALISDDSGLADGVERTLVDGPGSPRVEAPREGSSAYVRAWKADGGVSTDFV